MDKQRLDNTLLKNIIIKYILNKIKKTKKMEEEFLTRLINEDDDFEDDNWDDDDTDGDDDKDDEEEVETEDE